MAKTRTFIGIEASEEIRSRALDAIDQLSTIAREVKWVAPENLHWTLQFLGDLADVEVAEVCRAVALATVEHEPFLLSASGIGAFPKLERPRTLWLGADQGSDAITQLQEAIEATLAELGYRGESRKYVPHLTLGRVKRGSQGGRALSEELANLADYEGGAMEVEEVTVFASELEQDGPVYHVLSHAPLALDA